MDGIFKYMCFSLCDLNSLNVTDMVFKKEENNEKFLCPRAKYF